MLEPLPRVCDEGGQDAFPNNKTLCNSCALPTVKNNLNLKRERLTLEESSLLLL